MQLQSIDIKNFRGIDHCHLTFKPGFNLLIGENGCGKTSFLEAIAVGMGGFITGVANAKVEARHFSMDEVRTVYIQQGDGGYIPTYYWPEVAMEMKLGDDVYSWTRAKKNASARSTVTPRDISHVAEALVYDSQSTLPVISYQSAARVWSQKREKRYDITRLTYNREFGYIDCLTDEASMKLMLNWCSRMEQIAWQKEKPVREYEAVKQVISNAMSKLEKHSVRIFYDKQAEELMYQFAGTTLPIASLSAGYQSLIWMCFDIAYRMAVLNPALVDKINEAPGIVMIDELDVHLHPQWQWLVIDVLRSAFPNVQFIATTHSPLIIASAKDVWCINISDIQHTLAFQSGYGLEVQDVLQEIQQTNELPPEIQGIVKNFYHAIDTEELNQAETYLHQLEKEIGSNSPLVIKATEHLELEKSFAGD